MTTRKIVLGGLFAALIFVGTYFGVPVGSGYIHAGDGVINLAAVLLGPVGAVSAGIGSFLVDMLKGYVAYAVPTFIIKLLDALIVYGVFVRLTHKKKSFNERAVGFVVASALGSLVMIGGYFLTDLLYYPEYALFNVPWNGLQALVGVFLGVTLYAALGPFFEKVN
jgi:uncharacterized membrane protein